MSADPELPIQEHLGELRSRLGRSLLAVLALFAVTYNFANELIDLLLRPLSMYIEATGRGDVIFTGVTEPFMVQLKVSLLAAFFLGLPVIAWQMYRFLQPAFRGQEKGYFIWLFTLGGVLFTVGANFGYFGVLPFGVPFFVGLAGPNILPQVTMQDYFSFAVRMMLAFGFVFELPLAVTLLARMGLVDRLFFKRNRRMAVLLIFVGAAILTPPDILSQVMLGLPLLLLYEISAQVAAVVGTVDYLEDDDSDEPEDAPPQP